MELNTNDVLEYQSIARAYAYKEDYTHAIADYDKFIQLQPTNAAAFAERGLCKSRKGDFSSGIIETLPKNRIQLSAQTNGSARRRFIAPTIWLGGLLPPQNFETGKKPSSMPN